MDEQGRDRILSEQMLSRLDAIQELVQDVPEIKDRLGRVESAVNEMKAEQTVHTEILREHSATLAEHGADIRELKADVKEIKQLAGGHVEAIVELRSASHTH